MKNKLFYLLLVTMIAITPFIVMAQSDPELAECRAQQTEDIKLIQKQTDMIRRLTKTVEDQTKLIKEQGALIVQQTELLKKVGR